MNIRVPSRKAQVPNRPMMHRLSLRIALTVAGVAVLLVVVMRLTGVALPVWAMALMVVVVGVSVYTVVQASMARRLELARATLEQIHRYDFENLEATNLDDEGDELNTLIEQVYHTGVGVEQKMRELQRIEHYRREFLGNVSHELKTPIFSIRGFAETLLDGALDDERVRQSFVEKIQRNAERLGNLAEDLGEVARIEMGELKMTMEPFSLLRVVREVVESFEPMAQGKAVTLRHQVPKDLPPIAGDRERIRQVLTNLVDNAIKYNNAGGQVEVVARLLPSSQIKVSVVDDGIGIAPEHIARLTERFYRVDTSRSRSQGGTGLGLAIVKHILGAHDSQLMVESNPGRGSTFGFSLPTVQEEGGA